MKEVWGLFVLIAIYSFTLFWFGMWVEKTYINHLMPDVLSAEFVRGAKMGEEFGKADAQRDELQGGRCGPGHIEVKSDGK